MNFVVPSDKILPSHRTVFCTQQSAFKTFFTNNFENPDQNKTFLPITLKINTDVPPLKIM